MLPKRAREGKNEIENARLDDDNEESGGLRRIRETGSGCLEGSLAERWQCKHTRLNRVAYVHQCSVRFEVVPGNRVYASPRASSPRAGRSFSTGMKRLGTVACRTEYRTSPVDLLKAG